MAKEGGGKLFWPLTLLAFLASLGGGVLVVAQIDPPGALSRLGDALRTFDKPALVLGGATVVPLVLILLAYASSLRSRKPKRPVVGLYLLGFGFFWMVLAYVATSIGSEEFFTTIPVALSVIGLVVLSGLVRVVEMGIGKLCAALGDTLLKKEKWEAAATMLGFAGRLLPASRTVARAEGLALYEMGEAEQALEILLDAYRKGDRDPRLVKTLADSAFHLPEELASEVMAEALRLDPNNAKMGRKLVELYLRHNRPADAVPILEKFHDPNDLEDICLLGRLNAEQGNIERSLQLARRAVDLEGPPYRRSLAELQMLEMQAPENPHVLKALAELNERIGNLEEAASWYLSLLEVKDDDSESRRKLIHLYRGLGRLDQSLPHYRMLLRQEPESPEIALEYGQLLEDREDFDKALKVFQDFATRYPSDYRFSYHCAVCLFGLGYLAEATEALERARASAPESERAKLQSLASRIHSARVEKELGSLKEMATRPDADTDLRLNYIERLLEYDQAEQATRELDLLLDQRPEEKKRIVKFIEGFIEKGEKPFVLLNLLADLYLKEGEYDRCHELYLEMARQSLHPDEILAEGCRQILRRRPDHLPSLKSHSELLIKGGHYREAGSVMGKILDLAPEERERILPLLFEVYYQLGDAERAIPYGKELLKRDDAKDLNLFLRLHELMVRRDDHQGAIEILEQALEISPDNRQLREMLAESRERLKESKLESLREQVEREPERADLLRELADLYVEFGRINDAITCYQRAAKHAEGNLRGLCLIKLAHCVAAKRMFDLADETLRDLNINDQDKDHLEEIKRYLYEVGRIFEEDEQFSRALHIYKMLFKIDAGYNDIVEKIEVLSHIAH